MMYPMNTTPKPVTLAKAQAIAALVQKDLSIVPDWLTVVVDIAEIIGAMLPLLVLCGVLGPEDARTRAKAASKLEIALMRPMIRGQGKPEFDDFDAVGALAVAICTVTAASTAEEVAAVYKENGQVV